MSPHKSAAFALLAAALWFLLAAPSSPTAPPAPGPALTWTNPVLDDDYPDPSVERVGDAWWATATSSAHFPGLPLLRSPDLVHWQAVSSVFSTMPGWATDSLWAPELEPGPDGSALVYYTARRRHGPLCVAVASAPNVAGPYTDHGPLVCQRLGAIDPTRVDDGGRPYLVWKEDGNSAGRPTRLWARQLTPDGLHLIGRKRLLLANGERWDGGIIEAPEFLRRGPWLYLFYAGNTCCTPPCRYALGVARARGLFGPWTRDPANPILRSNRAWRCPGHASVVTLGSGQTMLVYHAYRATDRAQLERFGLLDRVDWGPTGWPTVNGGHGPSRASSVPAPRS